MDHLIPKRVTDINQITELIKTDPVRPNIPAWWRSMHIVPKGWVTEMFTIDGKANVCVAHLSEIPTSEEDLQTIEFNGIAVFYTVWSHEKGMGRQVLNNTLNIISNRATNTRFITLSPKTDMATKFHLSNGAILLQQNLETNNFEYKI